MRADICIVGGGSGGMAAAFAAASKKLNKKIVLLEAMGILGGTSTVGGVNAWEPGSVGTSVLHKQCFDALRAENSAVIAKYVKQTERPGLWALVEEDKELKYEDTLKHRARGRVVFHPIAMHRYMENELLKLGVEILYSHPIVGCKTVGERIISVTAENSYTGELLVVEADMFIDATAEIVLSRMAGAETMRSDNLNGVSQMFVVSKKGYHCVEELPDWVREFGAVDWVSERDPDVIFNRYPDGRLNVNTLPTLEGSEYLKLGKDAKRVAVARTYALWHDFQKERGFDDYKIDFIFPMLGVREGYHLVGRHVLDMPDLMSRESRDDFMAYSDHSLDFHSAVAKKSAADIGGEYGIPFECALPKNLENLAIASRGLSATPMAASSCRLQRTIMQVGESVGRAAAVANGIFTSEF